MERKEKAIRRYIDRLDHINLAVMVTKAANTIFGIFNEFREVAEFTKR